MAGDIDFSKELESILKEYDKEANETIFECFSEVGKQAKRDVVAGSPRQTGEYARGWTVRNKRHTNGSVSTLVYNRAKPTLTHLLENGHVVRNQDGTYGRVNGIKHIAPAQQQAEDRLMSLLKSKL